MRNRALEISLLPASPASPSSQAIASSIFTSARVSPPIISPSPLFPREETLSSRLSSFHEELVASENVSPPSMRDFLHAVSLIAHLLRLYTPSFTFTLLFRLICSGRPLSAVMDTSLHQAYPWVGGTSNECVERTIHKYFASVTSLTSSNVPPFVFIIIIIVLATFFFL